MDNNMISNIINIDRDINLEFRQSKLPLFIRKIIAKRKRNKLKKVIHKIKEMDIFPAKLLFDFLKEVHVYFNYYRSFVEIQLDENKFYTTVIRLKLSDTDYILVAIGPCLSDNTKMIIKYTYYTNSQTKWVNTEDNIEYLVNDRRYEKEDFPYNSNNEQDIIKDLVCKEVIDNVYDYLLETLKRSERLSEIKNDK